MLVVGGARFVIMWSWCFPCLLPFRHASSPDPRRWCPPCHHHMSPIPRGAREVQLRISPQRVLSNHWPTRARELHVAVHSKQHWLERSSARSGNHLGMPPCTLCLCSPNEEGTASQPRTAGVQPRQRFCYTLRQRSL